MLQLHVLCKNVSSANGLHGCIDGKRIKQIRKEMPCGVTYFHKNAFLFSLYKQTDNKKNKALEF